MAAIDLKVLDEQTGGDADLKRDVLSLFVAQARHVSEQCLASDEAALFRQALHRLQGSARSLGAGHLDAIAAACERELQHNEQLSPASTARLRSVLEEACLYAAAIDEGIEASTSLKRSKADKHLRTVDVAVRSAATDGAKR